MNPHTAPIHLAENLWLLTYPLKMLGADFRRNVTLIRLASGKLIIHSTAPFSPEDVVAIRLLGEPGWLLDGILRHDTFAKEGREAFPGIPYLAPEGFSERVGFPTELIVPAPVEWDGELLALEIAGNPQFRDTAFLHIPSRTLILTELVFNFGGDEPVWTELLLRVAIGGQHHPAMSRPMKVGIEDHAAFQTSLETILGWDFDRVIVGHGDVMEFNGKAKLHTALVAAGFPLAPIEFQPDQTQSMTTDPMCGLAVDTSSALHAQREGETFYFCSEPCRQKFLVTPGEANPFGKSGGAGG